MREYMEPLSEILGQELETFNRFLSLLDDQHKQLVGRDLDGLNRTNSELDLLSNKAGDLERNRQALTSKLTAELKMEGDNPTLTQMLAKLDGMTSSRLGSLRTAILDIHKCIEDKAARNRFLIEKSRTLIADSMKILAGHPSPNYEKPNGGRKSAVKSSLVNRSA